MHWAAYKGTGREFDTIGSRACLFSSVIKSFYSVVKHELMPEIGLERDQRILLHSQPLERAAAMT